MLSRSNPPPFHRYEATPENMNFVTTFWDSPTTRIGPTPDDCFGDDTTAPRRLGVTTGSREQFNPLTGVYEVVPVYHQLLEYDPAGHRGVRMSVSRYGGRADMYGGRDPVNNAGISSRDRTYICCGLPLNHPGCLMDTYSATTGDSVPYTYGLGKDFWRIFASIAKKGLRREEEKREFTEAVRKSLKRGTGWIDQSFYDDLHSKIQNLETIVTPLMVESGFQVSDELRRAGATAESVIRVIYSSLSTGGLQSMKDMFTLIAEYNRYRCNGKSVQDLPQSPSEWIAFVIQELFRLTAEQEIIEALGAIPPDQLRISRLLIDALPKFGSVAAARGSRLDMFTPAVTKEMMQLGVVAVPPAASAGPPPAGGAGFAPKKTAGGGGVGGGGGGALPKGKGSAVKGKKKVPGPGPKVPAKGAPGSPAKGAPGSPAKGAPDSVPGSPAKSVPGSPAKSVPGSPAKSVPGSPAKSVPGSPAKSVPGSPAKSVPGTATVSPAKSAAPSPAKGASGLPPVPTIDPFVEFNKGLAVEFQKLKDASVPPLTPLLPELGGEDLQKVSRLFIIATNLRDMKGTDDLVKVWLSRQTETLTRMSKLINFMTTQKNVLTNADNLKTIREREVDRTKLTAEQKEILDFATSDAPDFGLRNLPERQVISDDYDRILAEIPSVLSAGKSREDFETEFVEVPLGPIAASRVKYDNSQNKVTGETRWFTDFVKTLKKAPLKKAPTPAPGKGEEEEEEEVDDDSGKTSSSDGSSAESPGSLPVPAPPGPSEGGSGGLPPVPEDPVVAAEKAGVVFVLRTALRDDAEKLDDKLQALKDTTDPLNVYPDNAQTLLVAAKGFLDATKGLGEAVKNADPALPVENLKQLKLAFDRIAKDTHSVIVNVTDNNVGVLVPGTTLDTINDVKRLVDLIENSGKPLTDPAPKEWLLPKTRDTEKWNDANMGGEGGGTYDNVLAYLKQCLETVLDLATYSRIIGNSSAIVKGLEKEAQKGSLSVETVKKSLDAYIDWSGYLGRHLARNIFLLSDPGKEWVRDLSAQLSPPPSLPASPLPGTGDEDGLPPVPGAGSGGGAGEVPVGPEGGGGGAGAGAGGMEEVPASPGGGGGGEAVVVKSEPGSEVAVLPLEDAGPTRKGTLTDTQRENLETLRSVLNLLGNTNYSNWVSGSGRRKGVKIEKIYFPWDMEGDSIRFDFERFNRNVMMPLLLNLRGNVPGDIGEDFSNKPRNRIATIAFKNFTVAQENFLFMAEISSASSKGRNKKHPPAEQIGLVTRQKESDEGNPLWVLNIQWTVNADVQQAGILYFPTEISPALMGNVGRLWGNFISIVLAMADEEDKKAAEEGKTPTDDQDKKPAHVRIEDYFLLERVVTPAENISKALGRRAAVWTEVKDFARNTVTPVESSIAFAEAAIISLPLFESYNAIAEDVRIYPDGIDKADIRRADQMLKVIGTTLRHINEKQLYVRLDDDNEVISIDLNTTVQKNLIKPIMLSFQLVLLRLGQEKLAQQTPSVKFLKNNAVQFDEIASLGLAKFSKDVLSVQTLIDIGVLVRSKQWESSTDRVEEHLRTSAGFSTDVAGRRYMFIDRSKVSIEEQLALLSRWGAFAELLSMILDNKGDPNDYAMRNLAAEVSKPWKKGFVAPVDGVLFLTAEDLKSVIDSMDWSFGDDDPKPQVAASAASDRDLAEIAEWGE